MKTLTKIAISSGLLVPFFVYAATVGSILTALDGILKQIIPIIMILATVVFLWGVVMYVVAGGDEDKVKTAKQYIILGLIGLFIMVAVWGVVKALVNTFGVSGGVIPTQPGAF